MFTISQIKGIIRENNLHISKRLGQNFLIDTNIRDKLISLCDISKDDIVLEIGPGLGALTEGIIPLCKRLTTVEKDKGLSTFIKRNLEAQKNLELINKDILKYDISQLFSKHRKKIKVIGNLPFYITSPVIFYLLKYKRYISSIFITVQKEVAKRIVAGPGSKDYGLLSCSLQYHCLRKIIISIPKGCFFPRPEVDASLVELKIRKVPPVKLKDEGLLFKIIRSAFNQRRKTLFNALSGSSIMEIDQGRLKNAFERSGLDHKVRGEALSLEDFALLANNYIQTG